MPDIHSLSDELLRRQNIRSRIEENCLTLSIKGEDVVISCAENDGRVILWGEVAKLRDDEMADAADLSLRYNDDFAYSAAVSLGVSLSAHCALLGRNIEAPEIDSGRLLREAEEFSVELASARRWFDARLSQAKMQTRD